MVLLRFCQFTALLFCILNRNCYPILYPSWQQLPKAWIRLELMFILSFFTFLFICVVLVFLQLVCLTLLINISFMQFFWVTYLSIFFQFFVLLPPLYELILEIERDGYSGGRLLNLLHKRCHCGVPELQTCVQRYAFITNSLEGDSQWSSLCWIRISIIFFEGLT